MRNTTYWIGGYGQKKLSLAYFWCIATDRDEHVIVNVK